MGPLIPVLNVNYEESDFLPFDQRL